MSFSTVRPYFRNRFNTLGYNEWTDLFNTENIPENIIDRSYHINANDTAVAQTTHGCVEAKPNVITTLFFKGYRSPAETLDQIAVSIDNVLKEVLKPSTINAQTNGLRNVLIDRWTIRPIADTNDNTFVVEFYWIVQINIAI